MFPDYQDFGESASTAIDPQPQQLTLGSQPENQPLQQSPTSPETVLQALYRWVVSLIS